MHFHSTEKGQDLKWNKASQHIKNKILPSTVLLSFDITKYSWTTWRKIVLDIVKSQACLNICTQMAFSRTLTCSKENGPGTQITMPKIPNAKLLLFFKHKMTKEKYNFQK